MENDAVKSNFYTAIQKKVSVSHITNNPAYFRMCVPLHVKVKPSGQTRRPLNASLSHTLRCFQPTTRNIARNVTDNPSNACCYPDAAGNIAFGFNNMHDLR
ncbi:hypothetical protein ACLB1R_35745 [Escherichia coli]|uniref:Uncharacterized protein n=6 Tax=Enterobacteriaceae TaxID=543 RepID=A0A6G9I1M3_ECOLX|nr:hypothetical protein P131681_01020 [Salmonella enterica subsp. enterica serovar Typhimurium var. monophasic 4,[5],12:i:-]MBN3340458.1 hypothetical protein [Klebsiella pneumoniae]MDC7836179.1 hypothetical protein [Enterobacter hormaechei]QIQ13308.1 Hypothetical protein [Salmonella enterica]QIQ17211.1 hypothetical protein [Escherichia coli]WBR59751.1 hypothetical protein CPHELBEB_03779 [Salmonella sp.]